MLCFESFRLDRPNEQLWLGERRVLLKPLAFQVLCYLAERPQRLVSKRELLAALWADARVGEDVLKTQVKEIRRHLGDVTRTPRYIETVHRRGYRFIAPVTAQSALARAGAPAPGLAPATPESAYPTPAFEAVFVGRDVELNRLESLWGHARQGQRRLVFVTGEPGIGKTTLMSRFLERSQGTEPLWIASGQCVEQYGPGEAYLPFLEAFGRLCRSPDALTIREALRRKAPTWLMQMPESFDSADTVAAAASHRSVSSERMLREMADAIPAMTEERPLLIVLEDLHWADHSTLGLISYLAQRSDPARLFILCTYRSRDVSSSDHPLWSLLQLLESRGHGEELALRHLDDADVRAYLSARFPQRQFPADLPGELSVLTGGNPLFLSRVVDILVQRDIIQKQGEEWSFRGMMSGLTAVVPDRLVLLIAGETERLTPFERSVLDAASVAGFEFSVAALASALERDAVELEALCARWIREERFFRRASSVADRSATLRCEFCHTLYRQSLYQRLGPTRRMQLHLRLGLYEETLQLGRAQSSAGLLAMHFRLGGEPQRALRYGLLAGEQALRRSAYREAIGHFRTALDTLEEAPESPERALLELDLLVALSVPLVMTEGYAAPAVESVYIRARALCESAGGERRAPYVLGGMTLFYLVRGQLALTQQMAERFLALAETGGDPDLEFDAHLAMGMSSYFRGDFVRAREHLAPLLAARPVEKRLLFASAFHPSPYLLALCYLAKALWMLGYPDRAFSLAEEAVELARRSADPFSLACVLTHVVFVHRYRGDVEFFERTAELVALGPAEEFWFYGLYAEYHRGSAAFRKGRLEEGIEGLRRGGGAMHAAGVDVCAAGGRVELAEALLQARRFDEAFSELQEALEAAHRTAEHYFLPEIYRVYGEVCLAAPKGKAHPPLSAGAAELTPEAAFSEAMADARRRSAKCLELRAAVSLGLLWLGEGRRVEAERLVRGLYAGFSEGYDTYDLRRARALIERLESSLAS